jgi:hypothetical protein
MATKPISNEALKPKEFGRTGGTALLDQNNQAEGNLKYNVGGLTYPLNAGGAEYPHYAVFFINIRGKSKYKKDYKTVEVSAAGQNRGNATTFQQNANGAATIAGTLGGAVYGAKVAGKVLANSGKTVSGKAAPVGLAAGAVGGGLIGGTVANAAANALFTPDTTHRIDSSIMLAINERPSVSYHATYEGKDLGMLGALLAGGTSAVDSTRMDFAAGAVRGMLQNVAQIPSGVVNAMGGNIDVNALASFGTGMAQNPFREQIFQNVQSRTFRFDYKFLPRSTAERDAVQKILRMFRFHMHPELAADGLFYIYPSDFDIVYYYKGKENPYVNKISTCVLEDMKVDYGGSQQFSSFADGSPTEINLSLSFVEKEVLTKERVNIGY